MKPKFTRNFKKFNKREFGQELANIDWSGRYN